MNIALVEPSRAVRGALTQLLSTRGHCVSGFADPHAALEMISADEAVDGLITSAELTPISGAELCWEARLLARGRRPIYIMLMSSIADERIMIECLDMGADDLIGKPPSSEQLFARLRVGERNIALQHELIRLAMTDPMTGLFNRRAFFERGTELCDKATEASRPAAILFDIDHFKEVNDLYGHETGDEAIRALAVEAQQQQSIVGRLGGDELCILIGSCGLSCAWDLAEDLRRRISALQIRTPEGFAGITCSLGVSEWRPGNDIDDLIRSADLALYRAKREGWDCVSTPPTPTWIASNPRQTSSVARRKAR